MPVPVRLGMLLAAFAPGIIMELADDGASTSRGAVAHIDLAGKQPSTFDAAQKWVFSTHAGSRVAP